MSRRKGFFFLILSALFGFFVFAPVAPYQFQLLFIRNLSSPGMPVAGMIFGLLLIIVISFLFGRVFCGNICPIGALQEILSIIPVHKTGSSIKKYSVPFRAAVFAVFLAAGLLFSISLFDIMGVKDFFHLNFASFSVLIFSAFLAASVFIYRPFCRFICPYGLLLSLVSAPGIYKFRRTDKCIECGKCEKVCPVDEAKRDDNKSECYMCGRCMEVCPVSGALVYSRKKEGCIGPEKKN